MLNLEPTARTQLRALTGRPDAEFRDGQLEAIDVIVRRRGRALVVQRTGWGKSAVYFIATKLLREQGMGPTVIVSPLLVLMRNQMEMAERLGIRAETVNSTNRDDWEQVFERIEAGDVDLLLISPERLNNVEFRSQVMPQLLDTLGLLVIDEVHCISDWGHDFRPDMLEALSPDTPVLGTTATANSRVVADVRAQLGDDIFVLRGPLERRSLSLHVLRIPNKAERMAWLAQTIPTLPGAGIVYCLTVADAHRVGDFLRSRGIDASAYTGPMDNEQRLAIEQRLTEGSIKVVVATSALAMGYDNPKIEFVIHFQTPGSPVAYYQQVGRAGRAVEKSVGVALSGYEDTDIQDWFINTAFPPERHTTTVLESLRDEGGLRIADLEPIVNLRRSRLTALLKVLEVEGAVERDGTKWVRADSHWEYPAERLADVNESRRREQAAMAEYVQTTECLMGFLRHQLDDAETGRCGRCGNCTGESLEIPLDPLIVEAALRSLRSETITITPRRMAPTQLKDELGLKEHNLTDGRALTRWGDPGLAVQVERGKFKDGVFSDDLVFAMAEMVASWAPHPSPTWVTSVPSQSKPGLMADFASRVAVALGLPHVEAVRRTRSTPPQSEMDNSHQQARNAMDAFEVGDAMPGPVLLLDDTVDSKWTVTVVASKLGRAGSGPVFAAVLADTSRA